MKDEHFGSAVYVLVASGTLIGLAASNFAIISSDAPAFVVVLNFLLPLAVPLFLFRADLRRVVQSTGKLLLAFLIGSTKNQTCLCTSTRDVYFLMSLVNHFQELQFVLVLVIDGFERVKSRTEVRTEVKFWEWKNQVKFVCLFPETNEDSQETLSFLKATQFERRALSACEDNLWFSKEVVHLTVDESQHSSRVFRFSSWEKVQDTLEKSNVNLSSSKYFERDGVLFE
ncbi:hypothetical protein F2Q70_00030748 [Brassica cretica]|uniref:Uncharacterized protein n=1 Tax=Brassica cretica TaxID=69181 RepID=A0A8S9FFZ4_BRACR|nr:hypothetical protein F2Q70_00030748 [Brassica cretica]